MLERENKALAIEGEEKCELNENLNEKLKRTKTFNSKILVDLNKLRMALDNACRNLEALEKIIYEECEDYRETTTKTMTKEQWKEWILKCV